MTRSLVLAAAMTLGSCVYGPGGASPLPQLVEDRSQPDLALLEHLLTAHLAATPAPPTTCASLAPRALSVQQEKALIARFPRLAPRERCRASGAGHVDAMTGERAVLVEVYEFACADADHCSGWATLPGQPSARYGLRWSGTRWQFARDARLLAQ